MLRVLITVFSFICLSTVSALACSCQPLANEFFETVYLHNQKIESGDMPARMELTVVSAKVMDYLQLRPGPHPTEMVLNVEGTFQGNTPSKKIIVQGDDGFSCMPYVTSFPIGEKYLFALNKYQGNYYISACGVYAKQSSKPSTTK